MSGYFPFSLLLCFYVVTPPLCSGEGVLFHNVYMSVPCKDSKVFCVADDTTEINKPDQCAVCGYWSENIHPHPRHPAEGVDPDAPHCTLDHCPVSGREAMDREGLF